MRDRALPRLARRPFEALDYLDLATNVRVELAQVFGGNPIFPVSLSARESRLVACQKAACDLKSRHISRAGCRYVPIARDLAGILLGQHRIEDGLLGKARRKLAKSGPLDQRELGRPDRTVQRDGFGVIHVTDLSETAS